MRSWIVLSVEVFYGKFPAVVMDSIPEELRAAVKVLAADTAVVIVMLVFFEAIHNLLL